MCILWSAIMHYSEKGGAFWCGQSEEFISEELGHGLELKCLESQIRKRHWPAPWKGGGRGMAGAGPYTENQKCLSKEITLL